MATDKNGLEIKPQAHVLVDNPGQGDGWGCCFTGTVLCISPFNGTVCVAESPEERVHWEVSPNQIQVKE